MANRVYTSVPYAISRLAIWVALLALAAIDGIRHRQVRSRGWQLYILLIICTAMFVIRNMFFLGICIEGESMDGWATQGTYGAYIFFADIAESLWIFVLLAISSGFCITRTNLGPHKGVCIIIPSIFLVTSLVVDYVLFASSGLDAFNYKSAYASSVPPDDQEYDPTLDPLVVDGGTGFIFIFCIMANSMAFFMSWFYMYDTARMEWQLLQEGGADPSDPGARNPAPGTSTEGTGVGHSALPANVVLLEEGQNASHLYGDVVGDDLDAPKTVQDRIADRDKLRLMRQFFLAVSIYITVAVLVFFLPLFAPMTVDAALLVAYDCILWVFLAGLLWVFRLRQSNQFLLLTDDAVVGETTTELGVLYHDGDDDENEGPGSRYGGFGGARNGGVRSGAPAPAAPKYTLGDDEDEGQRYGGTRGRADSMEVNASAARHGVVVESLPTPQ